MTDVEQRKAAAKFAEEWKGRGYEKGESQPFWLALLRNVFGVEQPENYIKFEDRVMLDNTSFIDGFIAKTHVLIEQKGLGKDLRAKIKQSDGTLLTPFQQAKRYASELPYSERPRWIVTCNFSSFLVYDMENPQGEPEEILLENLEKEHYRLNFLIDTESINVKKELDLSLQAGDIVRNLYNEFLKQYKDPEAAETLRSLNMLCVRLVFCLYAEDAGVFGNRTQFHDYLKSVADKDIEDVRPALIELFKVLNQKEQDRDPYIKATLAAFPYVNGGLFDNENIVIPHFNADILQLLLQNASADFDWSGISPTIFGAVFESTLNPATRRSGGMHYTSVENIHKVIDPLFLDELKSEFAQISQIKQQKARDNALKEYQNKLANLVFLDPACGSGNFLTETYISLRRLENEALKLLYKDGQIKLDTYNIIKVSIGQFYGIEINDFAVSVAKTALWIAESQTLNETADIVNQDFDFLPLKSYPNITENNALRLDWEDVVSKHRVNYIMGNPPFVGHQWRNSEQQEDMKIVYKDSNKFGKLDYVCSWYKKAVEYMSRTKIRAAFVSTNSICQGESVSTMWKPLFNDGIEIIFAYHSFLWNNEAKNKAAVYCIIIGFAYGENNKDKRIYEEERTIETDNINGYLLPAPNVFIQSRGKPLIDNMPEMSKGSQPTDGGNLILSADERDDLIAQYPQAEKFIKRYIGADDFINNKTRYCLWLKGVSPSEFRAIPPIMERLKRVEEMRRKSPTESVRRDADTPMLFTQIRQPETEYLVVPEVSSERRKYIPIGYMARDIIASNMVYIIPNATLYIFGIISSNVHMAWARVICGRLKSDYRYTPAVYNNFPWVNATDEQKSEIERLAQGVLDARKNNEDCSLADLYDPLAMPPELLKAHKALDKAVMKLYGFAGLGEAEIVAGLMGRYREMTWEVSNSD